MYVQFNTTRFTRNEQILALKIVGHIEVKVKEILQLTKKIIQIILLHKKMVCYISNISPIIRKGRLQKPSEN